MNFYNDTEPYAAQWLRNLAAAGHIGAGDIIETPIQELEARQTVGYDRCHFFAGIGGWDLALQMAGWPVGIPVWTGSCPCQPFSAAGKQKGTSDERHLWPYFRELIRQCHPPIIFGEQVASKLGREWLSGVRVDLEAMGYAVGAADMCAAGVEAPHIRQRLWWVAYAKSERCKERRRNSERSEKRITFSGETSRMADAKRDTGRAGWASNESREGARTQNAGSSDELGRCSNVGGMGDTDGERLSGGSLKQLGAGVDRLSRLWDAYDIIPCADGKARRIESGTFPLAHGVPARLGKLRAYGNAIVPQVAAEFIKAVMEVIFV